jgi:hypothetical protein
LNKQKYGMLFSPNRRRQPGPKGPRVDLIHAVVVEMKQRNYQFAKDTTVIVGYDPSSDRMDRSTNGLMMFKPRL